MTDERQPAERREVPTPMQDHARPVLSPTKPCFGPACRAFFQSLWLRKSAILVDFMIGMGLTAVVNTALSRR